MELGADAVARTDADVVAKARELTGGAGMDIVVEHVGEATWKSSLQAARTGRPHRRLRRHVGPEPAGAAAPDLLEAALDPRLDDGHARGLRRGARPRRTGRAKPVVDRVFPLDDVRAAHEHLESGAQLGKVVLRI